MSQKPNDFPVRGALDGTEEIYTQTNDNPQKFTVDDVAEYIMPAKQIMYKEVDITSGQLLACFDTSIEILPAPDAGTYYLFEAILEYSYGGTPYTGAYFSLLYDALHYGLTDSDFIQNADTDAFMSVTNTIKNDQFMTRTTPEPVVFINNQDIAVGNPTLGNGTMKVKIWYTINTFG